MSSVYNNRVKYVREARGMTRSELALMCSVDELTIEAIEEDKWNCSIYTALKLALALSCDIVDLFYLGE